jgi:uncharacterized protein YndB with AHSA1/START domain
MIAADRQPFTLDRDANTVRFERRFAASPAEVFDAWTKPEQVTQWWDPDGKPLTECTIDLRVGGSFKFVSPGHSDMPFVGTYREIAPPHRLVFDALGAVGRVVLSDAAGGTRMLVEIICQSKEHLDQFVRTGVHEGTARTLDNLVAYVAGGRSPASNQ